jgi:hypothetical protein
MSIEWGKPKTNGPQGAPAEAPAAALPATPAAWEKFASAFPDWSLEPPFALAPRRSKPQS